MPLIPVSALLDLQHAHFAVVPVVAQAGTALFPLIMLAVTSTVGLLLKPRELLRVFRQKPWIPALLIALGLGSWWAVGWMLSAPAAPPTSSRTQPTTVTSGGQRTDWAKVALALIAEDAAAKERAGVTSSTILPVVPAPALSLQPATTTTSAAHSAPPAARFFRGDARRSGHLGGAAPRGLAPSWTFYAQDELNSLYLSSPLVAGEAVFGASCYLDPPRSYGTVFRLDAASGKPRWVCEFKNATSKAEFKGFFSSPALTADGKYLVIGQGLHTDYDSELVCLDANTGTVRWLIPTPLHLESSPCIEGDLVVIGAGAVEQGDQHKPAGDVLGRGNPGFVLGIRISDGKEIFRAPVNDPEGSPLLLDGICYVGSSMNGSAVVALRTQSDAELKTAGQTRELWRTPTPFPASGAVTLAGELLLMGCGKGDFVFAAADPEGRVIALDKTTGAVRWQTTVPDAVLGPIAVVGTVAIVPVRSGEVIAIDLAAQGKVLWQASINKKAPVLAGVAFTGTLVYAVSNDGYLVVLDATNGKPLERIYLNAKGKPGEMGLCTPSPLVLDGRLFVGSETGGLRCFVGTAP